MARYINLIGIAVCLLVSWCNQVSAATAFEIIDKVIHTSSVDEDVTDNATDVLHRMHCVTDQCRAFYDLNDGIWAILRYTIPNTMALGPPPKDIKQITLRRLQRGILKHPDRFSLLCGWMVTMASHVSVSDPLPADELVELSLRMDHIRGRCTPRMVTALPPGPRMDHYINSELRFTCRREGMGRCSDLRRP